MDTNYNESRQRHIIKLLRLASVKDEEYSVHGYCECLPCIEDHGDHWIVYDGERGLKHNVVKCASPIDVVNNVCDRLGYPMLKTRNNLSFASRRIYETKKYRASKYGIDPKRSTSSSKRFPMTAMHKASKRAQKKK